MDRFDVVIVGGGPSGSSCAWKLCEAGMDVLVIDKQPFPRDKTCAGWITPQVVQTLRLDAAEYRAGRVWQPITGFRTGLIGGREVHTEYGHTISYGIRRCEFDHYLLQRSGVPCRLGQGVRDIQRQPGRWVINSDVTTPLLIGAGGNFCPVARMLGAQRQDRVSLVVAQEAEFPIAQDQQEQITIAADTPELFFCPDLKGYGWCFRKGDYLNIGLGRMDCDRLGTHVTGFCDFLHDRGKVRFDIPSRFLGHAYRLYERVQPKLIDEGVMLIGDSAGLAYPQSGEGIRPAIESGLIAADVILKANGKFAVEQLAPYETQLTARLGTPRKTSATDWLPASWLRSIAGTLMATQWFSRRVVMDGWFLHTHQPALSA